ncbi:MAG TPA: ferritin-like domain-containing protein [Longimicrobiales bacterium]|nr:ferritin-like domain-containing protein [Longimicrobiales bacterium]
MTTRPARPDPPHVSATEMAILNFYRASELRGGLVLATVAERVRDPELFLALTRHGAEEVEHAGLWAETMRDLGGRPWPSRATAQACYAEVVGRPSSLLHVLALTQVFERSVYAHFVERHRDPATHPRIRRTLERMIEDEKGHLSWVRRWLDDQARARPDVLADLMRRYAAADRVVWDRMSRDLGYGRAA